jgi:hypothetical protein
MAAIIIILAVLVLICVVVSGVVYTRQQAIAHRESQTRHLKQKYQELDLLFQFIMNIDEKSEIAILLNNQLMDFAQQLIKLNKKSEEYLLLLDQLKTRAIALKNGTLPPKADKIASNDSIMRHHIAALTDIGQRFNRLKIRGQILAATYEEHLKHLKKLAFDIEYESHLKFAEKLTANNDIRNAVQHLKHAREALKKTRADITGKAEKIRKISEKILKLQRDGNENTAETDAEIVHQDELVSSEKPT